MGTWLLTKWIDQQSDAAVWENERVFPKVHAGRPQNSILAWPGMQVSRNHPALFLQPGQLRAARPHGHAKHMAIWGTN